MPFFLLVVPVVLSIGLVSLFAFLSWRADSGLVDPTDFDLTTKAGQGGFAKEVTSRDAGQYLPLVFFPLALTIVNTAIWTRGAFGRSVIPRQIIRERIDAPSEEGESEDRGDAD
jgi:hypothetical protein